MKNIILFGLLLFLASSCSQKRYGGVPKVKAKNVQKEQSIVRKPRIIIPSVSRAPVKSLPESQFIDSIVIKPAPTTVVAVNPVNIDKAKKPAAKKDRKQTVKSKRATKNQDKTTFSDESKSKKILKIVLITLLVAGLIILVIKIVPATTLAIILGIIVTVLYIALVLAVLYYCMKLFLDFVLMMGN